MRRASAASTRCSAAGATRRASSAARSGRDRGHRPRRAARSPPRPARTRRSVDDGPRRACSVVSGAAARRPLRQPAVLGEASERARRTMPRCRSDPAAELVELGEAEPIGALDDHDGRLGNVDADLDDRRADEHVELAVPEPRHLGIPLGRLQPAMDRVRPAAARASTRRRSTSLGSPRAATLAPRIVESSIGRHDDERPVTLRRLGPDELPQAIDVSRVTDPGLDRDPSLRRRPQIGDIEIGVDDLTERPWDRGRGHEQDVRRGSMGSGRQRGDLRRDARPASDGLDQRAQAVTVVCST